MVPSEEYQRLRQQAVWEPTMQEPDAAGNYSAMEAMSVALARDILRSRRKLGLSQTELARLAGIRPETLNRIEQGKHKPSVPTIDKIDRALRLAEQEESKNSSQAAQMNRMKKPWGLHARNQTDLYKVFTKTR